MHTHSFTHSFTHSLLHSLLHSRLHSRLHSLPFLRGPSVGKLLRQQLEAIDSPLITTVRGKGLLNAIVVKPHNGKTAWDVCMKLRDNGLLAKPTHDDIIRFAPPLVINEEQIEECADIIKNTIKAFE